MVIFENVGELYTSEHSRSLEYKIEIDFEFSTEVLSLTTKFAYDTKFSTFFNNLNQVDDFF